jgi:hypothetical protein
MRFARHAVVVAALVVAALPTGASAQTDDPAQGSPSGVIYEIPLDNARRDAAPGRGGGDSRAEADPQTTGGTVSPIRSENGFGSSSTVPGAATASSGGGSDDESGGGSDDESGGAGGGKGGSGSGGTPAPAPEMEGVPPSEALGGPTTASVAPSQSRAYLLLGLALAVALGIGVAGRYVLRRR